MAHSLHASLYVCDTDILQNVRRAPSWNEGLSQHPTRILDGAGKHPRDALTHSSLVWWLCSLTALISLGTSFSFSGMCRQNLLEKWNNIPSLEANIWHHFQDGVGSGPTGYSESARFCVLPTNTICGTCLGSAWLAWDSLTGYTISVGKGIWKNAIHIIGVKNITSITSVYFAESWKHKFYHSRAQY